MTHESWSKCWEMSVIEFFNYLTFSREYQRRQNEIKKSMYKQVTY